MPAASLLTAAIPLLLWTGAPVRLDLSEVNPESFADCAGLVQQYPESLEAYRCYLVVAGRTRREEAIRLLEDILARNPDDPRALYYLGFLHRDSGRIDRTKAVMQRAIDAFRAQGDPRGEAFARTFLAYWLSQDRRSEAAREQLDLAARAAALSDYLDVQAEVEVQRGWQAYNSGDQGQAWSFFKRAEALAFPLEPGGQDWKLGPTASRIRVQTGALSGLGAVCWATARYRQAFQYYIREADLWRRHGQTQGEAGPRYNIALLAYNSPLSGDLEWDEIGDAIRQALDLALVTGNKRVEAKCRSLWAQYLGQEIKERDGPPSDEPVRQLRAALELSRVVGNIPDVCLALRRLALFTIREAPSRFREAFDLSKEAEHLARQWGYWRELVWVFEDRSDLYAATGQRGQAIDAYRMALDAAERLRDIQVDGEVKARVFAPFARTYRELIGFLLSHSARSSPGKTAEADFEQAFSVSERMRARALLDELDAAGATPLLVGSDPLAERRNDILGEIARSQRQLMSGQLAPAKRKRTLAEVERLELEAARLADSQARRDPSFSRLRRPPLPPVRAVRASLGEREAILSFVVPRSRESWLLTFTRESVDWQRLPPGTELHRRIELFLGLIQRRDGSAARGAAKLYSQLLQRALEQLPLAVEHLIIIPDDVLFRLPFAALQTSDGRLLAERYRISMAPSATLWARLRQTPRSGAGGTVLALADPDLPESAPFEGSSGERQAGWDQANPARLAPLPHARKEGAAISRHLGDAATLLIGDRATEAFLKSQDLSPYGVIHLAAHGIIDDEKPDRTGLLLAPGSPREDGLLQVREIVQLNLSGKAVVLSACRSASGELVGGEGVMGLARALLQAGARAVVGNLWSVRDDDASVFFDRFYRHLADGENLAAALTQTQRDLSREGAPATAWAGVVLLGDGEFAPFPGGRGKGLRWPPQLYLASLAILLLLALFAFGGASFWNRARRD